MVSNPNYDPNFQQMNNVGNGQNQQGNNQYSNHFNNNGGDQWDQANYRDPFENHGDDNFDVGMANWTVETEPPFQYAKYNYSLPAIRTNYTLPTEPKPTNETIAVIILSERSNFERRQAIRESWAQNHSNVYFIIGGPEPDNLEDKDSSNPNSTSTRLFEEQSTFGDILDTIHPDTYKSLPYKVHFAIQWISKHPNMKQVQWIVKADDDAVVRINTLRQGVLRKFNPSLPIVVGRMEANSRPHRAGKWAEDPKFAEFEYPPWSYGSTGYVMSRPVADYVASEKSLYYYQGEDTSLGIWLYESPLDVTWIDSPQFTLEDWRWGTHTYSAIIGHDLTPEAIRECFEKYQDPLPLADYHHVNHIQQKGRIFSTVMKLLPSEEYAGFDYDESMWFQHFQQDNQDQWGIVSPDSQNEQEVDWQDEIGNQNNAEQAME
jgi:hypothetical protein